MNVRISVILEEGIIVYIIELPHEISNNVVCATSKASDQTGRIQIRLRIRTV